IPQLFSGPPLASEVPSVLPADTDAFLTASIDFRQTIEGMRKQAEIAAKDTSPRSRTYENGVLVAEGRPRDPEPDPFAEFEKKAGFKIKDDLLPVLGNEIAIAGSIKNIESLGLFGMPVAKASASPSPSAAADTPATRVNYPILLISIKDRDAARALMP